MWVEKRYKGREGAQRGAIGGEKWEAGTGREKLDSVSLLSRVFDGLTVTCWMTHKRIHGDYCMCYDHAVEHTVHVSAYLCRRMWAAHLSTVTLRPCSCVHPWVDTHVPIYVQWFDWLRTAYDFLLTDAWNSVSLCPGNFSQESLDGRRWKMNGTYFYK